VKYHHPTPHTPCKSLSAGTFCEDGATRKWRGHAEVVAARSIPSRRGGGRCSGQAKRGRWRIGKVWSASVARLTRERKRRSRNFARQLLVRAESRKRGNGGRLERLKRRKGEVQSGKAGLEGDTPYCKRWTGGWRAA
jgi:hypothetical protein